MPATRRRADAGQGAALREDLLAAAESLLEEGGERAVTVRAVAGRVGVTTPSVYLHFADRAELLDAVCLRVWDSLAASAAAAAARHDLPFAQLRARGHAYVRFALEHPSQYELLMMSSGPGRPIRAEAARRAYALTFACVDDCLATGVMRGDPQRLATGLLAAVHGVASLALAQPYLLGDDDEQVEAMVDHCIRMAGIGSAVVGRLDGHRASLPDGLAAPAFDRLAAELVRASPDPSRPEETP